MINFLRLLRSIVPLLPFIIFVLLDCRANLKKNFRDRQYLMPLLALVYGIIGLVFAAKLGDFTLKLIDALPALLIRFSNWLAATFPIATAGQFVAALAESLADKIALMDLQLVVMVVLNTLLLLLHIIVKRILITIFKAACKNGRVHNAVAGLFYEYDEATDRWYLKPFMGQARDYMKMFFWAVFGISIIATLIVEELYRGGVLEGLFYPAFAIIVIGELYFFVCGITMNEANSSLKGEEDQTERIRNYIILRKVLRKLFGDKLAAEDTSTNYDMENTITNSDILDEMEKSEDRAIEAYSIFMRRWLQSGRAFDQNYLLSGKDLLEGKSILFNDPFYYDLIPYAFYAMNRTLLRHKKVLVVLGRHGIEDDIVKWCQEGFRAVTNVEMMWDIKVLGEEAADTDVGILIRSDVNDNVVQEQNDAFLKEVEFVMIIEPSKLVTTAQIGLNAVVRRCSRDGKSITYCSTDKNCDGLVDALSHILMTNLTEVSATNKHSGVCSYMCWTPDSDILQHRMLPNISRYLGVGTELSFAAVKNRVSETRWYGGDAFPVEDMKWIAGQYYYDLLRYADQPATKDLMDRSFKVSHNLWNARQSEFGYITVEDEANNMFEVKRCFSTRATEQSFINVISPQYLLHDYMGANNSIFDADPKAIPYIVADYARTRRNVLFRLCLRMSRDYVPVAEIKKELILLGVEPQEIIDSLWHELCISSSTSGESRKDAEGREVLELGGKLFNTDVFEIRRKYSVATGRMEEHAHIGDEAFCAALLGDLQNAKYIAEDEDGTQSYLGTELSGQVFQKYLPGQFFTLAGKYYEMLTVTTDGRVLVRRAADHITGRPVYRQHRDYCISNVVSAAEMGSSRTVGKVRIVRQNADITVNTPLYWELRARNNFETARKVVINGIPERVYKNKQILKIDFPETGTVSREVRDTLAQLINELFVTLFAENASFISAVTTGESRLPLTYSVSGGDDGAIYIIEDSQMDLGLLVAVERNVDRIFSTICDYLNWHFEELDRSLHAPVAPVAAEAAEPETAAEPARKKGLLGAIGAVFGAIGRGIKKFFKKIADFFKKLFSKKPKAPKPEAEEPQDAAQTAEVPEDQTDQIAEDPEIEEDASEEPVEEAQEDPEEPAAEDEETAEEAQEGQPEDPQTVIPMAIRTEELTGELAEATADDELAGTEPEEELDDEPPVLAKTAAPAQEPAQDADTAEEGPAEDAAEEPAADDAAADAPQDAEPAAEEPAKDGEILFEADNAVKAAKKFVMEPAPYHKRHYMLYGGTEVPASLDPAKTLEFLNDLGFFGEELKDAREGLGMAAAIESSGESEGRVSRTCDFCGAEINGIEYEVLKDGRERCNHCSRTAIKNEEELKKLYAEVMSTMQAFYNISINAPVNVSMVNAKTLHKAIGKSFVPTGSFDGRVLGFARPEKDGTFTLYVENGAPRMQTIMTTVHEMTHVWQFNNWDRKAIRKKYGKARELEIYEGMAMWSEIQYAYLMGEPGTGKREELNTLLRNDEYGRGFRMYADQYPISDGTYLKGSTPFDFPDAPIK